MSRHLIIYGLIAALGALLLYLGEQLPRQLDELSTAKVDNSQWSVFQLETEFANLRATLSREQLETAPDSAGVRLQTDIVLSRVDLVGVGQPANLWKGNEQASHLLSLLVDYEHRAVSIIDQPGDLSPTDVRTLAEITDEIRPTVRSLAVLGVTLVSQQEETKRKEIASQIRRSGLVGMLLIAGLTVVLIYLDRLVAKAQRQDAAIRATTDRLASTVAASLDGIVTADEKGEIVGYNDAAEHIFGWTRDEILGRKLDDTLVPQAHRTAHGQGMARYLSTREPHVIDAGRLELSALRKTGEEFPVEMNITSTSQDGRELFNAYLRDISERKINERKLIDARDQAERTDRAKSQFLAVTSHEMRTPLNGILGVLDLLRTTELDEKQTKFVKVAAASGEILLEHVNEALDITRIETGAMSLTIRPFAMHEIVSRIVDVLQPLASEKGLRLDYKIEPAMDGGFVGDSGRISQILTNLLGNAIKFTDSGHIALEVTGIHGVEATALEISVKDTGAGIPAERVDDIFEDFVVLAQSEGRQARGDGLGLSISRKVARLMGGDLTVQSELGKGSEFTLKLTLERDDIEVEKPAEPRTLPHDRPKTVLIVEDNAINRSVLREMLVGFDHSVEEAENGLEGVKAASKKVYDVIFMDISMPFMDGIEATKRLRQDPGPNQRSFILGLTAHGLEEYRMKAEASGMDAFMTKPLRLSTLKQMMSGIAPAVSVEIGQAALIDEEVVRDLNAVLGSEKAKSTADRFRKELSESISDLRNRSCEEEAPIISESLHKMRGAAVLLGLTMLAEKIDQTSKFGKENNSVAFLSSLDDIQAVADTSLAVFSASLTTSSDEPLS